MKCFTDEQLDRGIEAVLGFHSFGLMTTTDWRQVFLDGAKDPAVAHPIRCAVCQRKLTDEHGETLVLAPPGPRPICPTCAI